MILLPAQPNNYRAAQQLRRQFGSPSAATWLEPGRQPTLEPAGCPNIRPSCADKVIIPILQNSSEDPAIQSKQAYTWHALSLPVRLRRCKLARNGASVARVSLSPP